MHIDAKEATKFPPAESPTSTIFVGVMPSLTSALLTIQ
jgi:hypothetical protein